MNSKGLGKRIQELRKLNGITQEELADKTNLSVRTIQRIENGETDPRNFTLQAIAEALNVEIKDLVDEAQKEHPVVDESYVKSWLAILHLSGFLCLLIPPLLVYILKKDEIPEMEQHGKDVLNFQLSMWIYLFSSSLLVIVLIGIPILIFLGIFSSIVVVLNSIRVITGQSYRYPLSIRILK